MTNNLKIVLNHKLLNECLTSETQMESNESNESNAFETLSLNQFLNLLILNVNNSEKCDVWSDILLDLMDNNVVNEWMLSQILIIAEEKSRSQVLANRLLSCQMLSKLCLRFNGEVFTTSILSSVTRLCNDCEPKVRANISKQLFLLSQNLSWEAINCLITILIEMTNDNQLIVKMASIESLIDFIPKLEPNLTKETVLPQIIIIFNSALKTNDTSLPLIFKNFGKLCRHLPKELIVNQKWFLDYYFNVYLISNDFPFKAKELTFNDRDINCRSLVALFFPIILQIYGPNESLYSVLNFLCCDVDITVVQTIASVFGEINAILKNGFKIYSQLSVIMNQRNTILIKEMIPFLSHLLIEAIKSAPNEQKEFLFDDITRNLISCENTISLTLDWRLHINFFGVFSQVMAFIPLFHIKTHFIPLIMSRVVIKSKPIPVRIESSRCLLCLFRDFPLLLENINIYDWFVTTLCYGKSCSQRMLFLSVCQLMNEFCDTKTLIEFILEPMVSLCSDKVPNIRLNVCKQIKVFKKLLKSPEISEKVERIKAILKRMLSTEKDRDVIQEFHKMVDELNWKLDFEQLFIELMTKDFSHLNIETHIKVNNNIKTKEVIFEEIDSTKVEPYFTKTIHSPSDNPLTTKCLSNTFSYDSIPSRIPKPKRILKSLKN